MNFAPARCPEPVRATWLVADGRPRRLASAGGGAPTRGGRCRQLEAAGVARRGRGAAGVVLSRPALERLYVQEQLSVAEVARRFEVSKEVVVRNLRSYERPRRDRHAPLDRDTLRRLYVDEPLGVRAVAARLGVSPNKVRAESRPLPDPDPPSRPPSPKRQLTVRPEADIDCPHPATLRERGRGIVLSVPPTCSAHRKGGTAPRAGYLQRPERSIREREDGLVQQPSLNAARVCRRP